MHQMRRALEKMGFDHTSMTPANAVQMIDALENYGRMRTFPLGDQPRDPLNRLKEATRNGEVEEVHAFTLRRSGKALDERSIVQAVKQYLERIKKQDPTAFAFTASGYDRHDQVAQMSPRYHTVEGSQVHTTAPAFSYVYVAQRRLPQADEKEQGEKPVGFLARFLKALKRT